MIEKAVETSLEFITGERPEALDGLLADDVVVYSPVVYTPQRGKDVAKVYLRAAAQALPGEPVHGALHLTRQVLAGDVAVLEFETSVDGKYVNGVDIIRCDDTGRIVEVRVMIRPLQAIRAVHEQMRAMLAALQPSPHPDAR